MSSARFQQILFICFTSCLLIIGGYTLFPVIFKKFILAENAEYIEQVIIETKFKLLTRFAIACGLYPITCFITWKLSGLRNQVYRFSCCLLIAGSMIIGFIIRYNYLKKLFRQLGPAEYLRGNFGKLIRTGFPVRSFHFEYSIVAGLIAGLVLCVIIFRIWPDKTPPDLLDEE